MIFKLPSPLACILPVYLRLFATGPGTSITNSAGQRWIAGWRGYANCWCRTRRAEGNALAGSYRYGCRCFGPSRIHYVNLTFIEVDDRTVVRNSREEIGAANANVCGRRHNAIRCLFHFSRYELEYAFRQSICHLRVRGLERCGYILFKHDLAFRAESQRRLIPKLNVHHAAIDRFHHFIVENGVLPFYRQALAFGRRAESGQADIPCPADGRELTAPEPIKLCLPTRQGTILWRPNQRQY
jgi:hypothetical protein